MRLTSRKSRFRPTAAPPGILRELGRDHAKYAWRLWSYAWKPAKSGDYVILSRASDSQGRVQADAAVWNPSGYLYNAYDQVKVYVQA